MLWSEKVGQLMSLTTFIYKKGSSQEYQNYRVIIILSSTAKMITRITEKKLRDQLEQTLEYT